MPTIIFISDTHTKHQYLTQDLKDIYEKNPDATLVHAGDISFRGRDWEIEEFAEWYSSLPFKNKIMIAGNHDFLFEEDPAGASDILDRFPGITYLNDSGVEFDGVKYWGSPVTPRFHDWAFNRDADIAYYWNLIPDDTDVLITHGPPFGILDRVHRGGFSVGCPVLLEKTKSLSNLKIHVFGHIHEGAGIMEKNNVTYINASTLNLYYDVANSPIIINL
jgi:Icc-related predicted phosphoesterase